MDNSNLLFGALGLGLAAVLGGAAFKNTYVNKQAVDKAAEKALDRYFHENPINVREEVIAGAVDRAVDNRVRGYVDRAGNDIMRNASNAIKKRVDEAYSKEEARITTRIGEELSAKVYELNKKDIRGAIANKAEELLEDKLDNCIDEKLDEWLEDEGSTIVSERAREATRSFRRW